MVLLLDHMPPDAYAASFKKRYYKEWWYISKSAGTEEVLPKGLPEPANLNTFRVSGYWNFAIIFAGNLPAGSGRVPQNFWFIRREFFIYGCAESPPRPLLPLSVSIRFSVLENFLTTNLIPGNEIWKTKTEQYPYFQKLHCMYTLGSKSSSFLLYLVAAKLMQT